jgi:hypothetical protein
MAGRSYSIMLLIVILGGSSGGLCFDAGVESASVGWFTVAATYHIS